MRYPITPDYLENIPNYIVQLYRDLEEYTIADICRRFRLSGEATESALEQIRILQRQGLDLKEIERKIRQTLNLTERELDELYQRAVDRDQEYFNDTIGKADIVQDTYRAAMMAQQVEAIRRQTQDEFINLTQSLGFAIRGMDGKVQFLSIAKTYQKILDDAEMQVWSGAIDYNTAIRVAVKRLTDSGLQTVDYASGWHNRADVAARRAVMTGVNQISARYSEQLMDVLGTRYVETTAHSGARDVDGPKGWENHKKWQGRWYYWSVAGEPDPLGKYPDFIKTTGYGDVTGLEGANCRHSFYPVIPGVNEPTYTEEQLANIDPPPFTYQGREYTIYQATQKQRQLETAMRDCKTKMIGYKAAGMEKEYQSSAIRLKRLQNEYKNFSQAANLRTQPERARVAGFGTKEVAEARSVVLSYEKTSLAIRKSIKDGEYPLTINTDKQLRHMLGTALPGRSVITVSVDKLQNLVNQFAGTGEIWLNKNGEWSSIEEVDTGEMIGYTVNNNNVVIKTTKVKIHYSKTGIHVVPYSGGRKNED